MAEKLKNQITNDNIYHEKPIIKVKDVEYK
jgi:hypothetical protein